MTSRISVQNLSDGVLKMTTMTAESKVGGERLIMNREPQEFTLNEGEFLCFSESESADDADDNVVAKEAAYKEPQRLSEQRNPQVTLTSQPRDIAAEAVPHATPMANTPVKQVPAQPAKTPEAQATAATKGTVPPSNNAQKAP